MVRGQTRSVVIIGSGFGGIGAAITLLAAGVRDVVLLERAGAVGGTWRDNTYPDAACDIPAHLYSFSFAPKPDWSTVYPQQPEIRAYLEQVVDDFGLRPRIRFHAEVTEARFDEDAARWTVTTTDGRTFVGDALVAAPGPLSNPTVPPFEGRDDFVGPQFHSARWRHDLDVTGLRVGVVGTGASSIQFVPWLADHASSVTVFQRSAPWVIPRLDRTFTRGEKAAFRHVPGLRALYRWLVYWQKEIRFVGFPTGSPGMKAMEAYSRWHMQRAVTDPALRAKLRPDYAMGCKRILISNDYYPALARDHVDVVTDPIDRVTPSGILLRDGTEHELDALVWATGFAVAEPLGRMRLVGRDDQELSETWRKRPRAHLGTTVPGFPNFFMVLGPNTGLAHNSMIYIMESQFAYIADAVTRLAAPDVAAFEVRDDTLNRFEEEMTERSEGLVWTSGCHSWYVGDDGTNFALWPGFTFEYRKRTSTFDEDAYHAFAPAQERTTR
jgi:cation diffusion facilitator CzcD-associated flavoprotein CzcO